MIIIPNNIVDIAMLRSLQAVAVLALRPTQPCLAPLLRPSLFFRSLAPFSSVPDHPFLVRLMSIVSEEELEQPLTEIAKLNEENKETAMRIILQRIRQGTFTPRIMLHEKFLVHIKRFPALHVSALLLRIERELRELEKFIATKKDDGKKIAVKDINLCFTAIFEALKKIPRDKVIPIEIQVYRDFASYHKKYLLRLVEPVRAKEVLKKSVDFYKSALSKIVSYLERQEAQAAKKGENDVLEDIDITDLSEEEVSSIEDSIEYKRFKYAEEYCEILYKLMDAQNYLTDPRANDTPPKPTKRTIPFMYHAGLFPLTSLFSQAITLYDKIQAKLESKYFYKIKKTFLELQHYEKLQKNKDNLEYLPKEIADFNKRMDELTAEIIENLQKMPYLPQTLQIQESQCLLLLGIKSNKLVRLQITKEKFEEQLLKQVKSILDLIKHENIKKLISINFCHVTKTVMRIDFEKHLGKLPRSTRYQGKRREK